MNVVIYLFIFWTYLAVFRMYELSEFQHLCVLIHTYLHIYLHISINTYMHIQTYPESPSFHFMHNIFLYFLYFPFALKIIATFPFFVTFTVRPQLPFNTSLFAFYSLFVVWEADFNFLQQLAS